MVLCDVGEGRTADEATESRELRDVGIVGSGITPWIFTEDGYELL